MFMCVSVFPLSFYSSRLFFLVHPHTLMDLFTHRYITKWFSLVLHDCRLIAITRLSYHISRQWQVKLLPNYSQSPLVHVISTHDLERYLS
jgi:hypothetical protein